MTTVGYATLDVIPSVRGLSRELDKQVSAPMAAAGKRSGQRYGAAAGTAAASDFKGKFSGALKGFAPFAGILAGAGIASLFGNMISEAKEAGKVSRVTAQLVATTGKAANLSAGQIGDLSERLMDYAAIDDEVIQAGANVMLTFKNVRNEAGRGNDIFDRSTKAALDLSAVLGTDLSSSALQLGKALNDPLKGVTALGRAGVQFSADQKATIKNLVESGDLLSAQKMILAEVESQVDGAAGAAADGTDRLAVAFGNLQESAGQAVLPALEAVSNWAVDDGIPAMTATASAIGDVIDVLGEVPTPVYAAAGAFTALKLASAAGVGSGLTSAMGRSSSALESLRIRAMLAADEFRNVRSGSTQLAGGLKGAVGPAGRLSASLRGVSTFAQGAGTALRRGLGGALTLVGGAWGAAFIGGAAILATFIQRQREAKQHVEEHTAALNEQTGALTEQNETIAFNALQQKGVIALAQKYGLSLDDVRKAALGNEDASRRLNAELDRQAKAYQTAGEVASGGDSLAFADDANKIREALGTETSAVQKSQRAHEAKRDFMSSDDTTERAATQAQTYAGQIDRVRTALEKLIAKEKERALRAIQQRRDQIALRDTFRAAHEEAKRGNRVLEDGSKAADENMKSLLDIADQWANSKAKVTEARGAYEKTRREFIKVAEEMGATKKRAKELADDLLKLPKNVQTKYRSEGWKKALDEIRILKRAARAITVPLIYSNKPRAGDEIYRASGGPVYGRGTSTSDSIPAWLSNGEYVHRTKAVDYYGLSFMNAINNLKFPKVPGYANGGPVSAPSTPAATPSLIIDQRGSVFQVHDYKDFQQQNQRRAERAGLSMVRADG